MDSWLSARSLRAISRACARLAVLLGWGLVACGGEVHNVESTGHYAAEDDFKGCPENVPAFETGLQAEGSQLAARVLGAMPAEPERYSNRWDVELCTLDGAPAPDAEITRGQTFMPVHGHDGRVEPVTKALGEPAQFQVDRLNFTMRGTWEVRLWLSSATWGDDMVVFTVCVAK